MTEGKVKVLKARSREWHRPTLHQIVSGTDMHTPAVFPSHAVAVFDPYCELEYAPPTEPPERRTKQSHHQHHHGATTTGRESRTKANHTAASPSSPSRTRSTGAGKHSRGGTGGAGVGEGGGGGSSSPSKTKAYVRLLEQQVASIDIELETSTINLQRVSMERKLFEVCLEEQGVRHTLIDFEQERRSDLLAEFVRGVRSMYQRAKDNPSPAIVATTAQAYVMNDLRTLLKETSDESYSQMDRLGREVGRSQQSLRQLEDKITQWKAEETNAEGGRMQSFSNIVSAATQQSRSESQASYSATLAEFQRKLEASQAKQNHDLAIQVEEILSHFHRKNISTTEEAPARASLQLLGSVSAQLAALESSLKTAETVGQERHEALNTTIASTLAQQRAELTSLAVSANQAGENERKSLEAKTGEETEGLKKHLETLIREEVSAAITAALAPTRSILSRGLEEGFTGQENVLRSHQETFTDRVSAIEHDVRCSVRDELQSVRQEIQRLSADQRQQQRSESGSVVVPQAPVMEEQRRRPLMQTTAAQTDVAVESGAASLSATTAPSTSLRAEESKFLQNELRRYHRYCDTVHQEVLDSYYLKLRFYTSCFKELGTSLLQNAPANRSPESSAAAVGTKKKKKGSGFLCCTKDDSVASPTTSDKPAPVSSASPRGAASMSGSRVVDGTSLFLPDSTSPSSTGGGAQYLLHSQKPYVTTFSDEKELTGPPLITLQPSKAEEREEPPATDTLQPPSAASAKKMEKPGRLSSAGVAVAFSSVPYSLTSPSDTGINTDETQFIGTTSGESLSRSGQPPPVLDETLPDRADLAGEAAEEERIPVVPPTATATTATPDNHLEHAAPTTSEAMDKYTFPTSKATTPQESYLPKPSSAIDSSNAPAGAYLPPPTIEVEAAAGSAKDSAADQQGQAGDSTPMQKLSATANKDSRRRSSAKRKKSDAKLVDLESGASDGGGSSPSLSFSSSSLTLTITTDDDDEGDKLASPVKIEGLSGGAGLLGVEEPVHERRPSAAWGSQPASLAGTFSNNPFDEDSDDEHPISITRPGGGEGSLIQDFSVGSCSPVAQFEATKRSSIGSSSAVQTPVSCVADTPPSPTGSSGAGGLTKRQSATGFFEGTGFARRRTRQRSGSPEASVAGPSGGGGTSPTAPTATSMTLTKSSTTRKKSKLFAEISGKS